MWIDYKLPAFIYDHLHGTDISKTAHKDIIGIYSDTVQEEL